MRGRGACTAALAAAAADGLCTLQRRESRIRLLSAAAALPLRGSTSARIDPFPSLSLVRVSTLLLDAAFARGREERRARCGRGKLRRCGCGARRSTEDRHAAPEDIAAAQPAEAVSQADAALKPRLMLLPAGAMRCRTPLQQLQARSASVRAEVVPLPRFCRPSWPAKQAVECAETI